jgi:hypothetical protein
MDAIILPRTFGATFNSRWITLATLCMAVLVAQVDTAVSISQPDGLRLAMILSGCVQIACAVIAWATTRPIAP